MKRDKELIRAILFAVEGRPAGSPSMPVKIPGRTLEEINGHVELMIDAGFLLAEIIPGTEDEAYWFIERLTYNGHEFLATIRNPEVWRRTKALAEKAGGFSLQFLFDIAKAQARHVLAEHGIGLS